MKISSVVVLVVLVGAGVALASRGPWAAEASGPSGASEPPQGRLTLTDLAWLEGRWSGDALGGRCEEQWSGPAGGTMMGMFRLVSEDKTSLLEFLVFEQTSTGVELHFKHFSPDFVPWEKERALTLELDHSTDTRWVFLSPDPKQSPSKVVYARPDTDQIIVTVESLRDGGEPESFDIVLKRGT